MKTANLRLLLALGLMLHVIVACGPTATQAPATTAPTEPPTVAPTEPPAPTPTAEAVTKEAEPKRGGTVRLAVISIPKNLDPHKAPSGTERKIAQLIYDYLVMLDKDLAIQPGLATDWKVSDDGLTWTFQLRKGVKFHNGRELKAADVKYSFERIKNPDTGSARAGNFAVVNSIEAPDDYTVVLELSEPNAALPTLLADTRSTIVAKEIVEEKGDLSQADAGSGPFKFVELKADGTVVLERNPDYWEEGLPYLDRVELVPVPDNSARNTALRTGDVDIINFVTTNFITLLREEPNIVIGEPAISGQFYYLTMNTKVKPFDDIKVRQAIAYAIDRKAVTQGSLQGEGYPLLAGPIPPWHWAALDEPIYPEPDLEKAKQLLAESSVPDGFEFVLRIWAPQDYAIRAAQLVQDQLAPLNIKPNIEQQGDWGTYWAPVMDHTYEATIQGDGGNVDPDDWLYVRFHSEGGRNYPQWGNPEVDELLKQGRWESDPEKRKTIYDEAQRIIAIEAPMVFLFNMHQTDAWRDYVEGYYNVSAMTFEALKETWLSK